MKLVERELGPHHVACDLGCHLFFFSSRRRHTRFDCDWSSDVCSSDLLIQSVIETLLFYHPAVWWASQQVREEREHCCDDLAVVVCGDAHLYATALLGMERLRVATPGFALAAAGRGGSLMGRIRRLVAPVQTEIFPRWMAGVIAVTLALGGRAPLATGTAATGDRGR